MPMTTLPFRVSAALLCGCLPAAFIPFREPLAPAMAEADRDSVPWQPPLPDTGGLLTAVRQARIALRALPSVWGVDGAQIEWIFTDGRAHAATEQIGAIGALRPMTLPAQTVIANHRVDVAGRRWAMIRLPLSGDSVARVRLLVHEAMHTLQPERLPRPARTEAGMGGDFLDGEVGRSWLFLELRALARALSTSGQTQREAAQDALRFRSHRDSLAHAVERERLDALDLMEGLPEYTGWRLSGTPVHVLATRLQDAAASRVSWVRAIGYWTGPAYGLLLDQLTVPRWHDAVRGGDRLPALLARTVGMPAAEPLMSVAARYDGIALLQVEHARAVAQARLMDSLQTRFLAGPVLRLIPTALRVSFDPNGQVSLGAQGTVMRGFRWAGADSSELVATDGALVNNTWEWAQVPLGAVVLPDGVLAAPRALTGDGWHLRLGTGWRVTRIGQVIEVRPPL